MKNTFVNAAENRFTRKWGTLRSAVDPYITGYHFIKWTTLPPDLPKTVKEIDDGTGITRFADLLSSLCLQVTLPTGTVNRAEINGLGNLRSSVPSYVDWDTTVSMRFLELSGLPIYKIISGWVRLMRDYRIGVSKLTNNMYGKSRYAGTAYYWTTSPDGKTIEFACCLAGLFPLKDPIDSFGHDLTGIDKLEIDVDFNVDYIYRDSWVYQKVAAYANLDYNKDYSEEVR